MCNPAVQFGFQAAGQVGGYMSQRAAVKARNRARLLNFRQDNIAYYNDAILADVKWKNQQQDTQIAYDNIFQQMSELWRQQDLAVEQARDKHARYNVEALQEMYRKEYAGTQTGVTASRLANEPIRKIGMALTKSQRELMMAKDKALLQKEIIRNDANRRRRAAFQKTWRSPVPGFTPTPPALESGPSAGALVLGLAGAAVQSFGGSMFSSNPKMLNTPNVGTYSTWGSQGISSGLTTGSYSSLMNPNISFTGTQNLSNTFGLSNNRLGLMSNISFTP